MKAEVLLRRTADLILDREKTHGDRQINFHNIARLWASYLSMDGNLHSAPTPADVARMMALLKIARMKTGSANSDDYVDAAGYIAIAAELALED